MSAPPPYQQQPNQGYPNQGYGTAAGAYDPNKAGAPAGAYNPGGPVPSYQQQPVVLQPQVVMVGGCPICRIGVLEEDYTCCGVLLAILFFPIGILCCLAMRQRRCTNCGGTFG